MIPLYNEAQDVLFCLRTRQPLSERQVLLSHPAVRRPTQMMVINREACMVSRIWLGWTTAEIADREILPIRRPSGSEVEYVTVMLFDSLEAVKQFAGDDCETAYVPPKAQAVLSRFDRTSQHYEIRERISYEPGRLFLPIVDWDFVFLTARELSLYFVVRRNNESGGRREMAAANGFQEYRT